MPQHATQGTRGGSVLPCIASPTRLLHCVSVGQPSERADICVREPLAHLREPPLWYLAGPLVFARQAAHRPPLPTAMQLHAACGRAQAESWSAAPTFSGWGRPCGRPAAQASSSSSSSSSSSRRQLPPTQGRRRAVVAAGAGAAAAAAAPPAFSGTSDRDLDLPTPGFHSIPEALAAMNAGELVVVLDDEDRENEGDLIAAADRITHAAMAFMVRYTSGVVCVGMEGADLDRLRVPLMVSSAENEESMYTAFTVTVDLREGTSTGISAADRAATLRALADPASQPADFKRPGHIFPLRCREVGGVEVGGEAGCGAGARPGGGG